MRTVLILAFACLIFFRAEAQLSLRGKIADNDGKPFEYARVSVKNMKDTTNIKDAFTDKTGDFSFSMRPGDYELTVNYIGESLLTKKFSLSDNLNLGTLKVKPGNRIESVTVSGKKPLIEQKIDRLVFNVENSIAASGGDALDALRVTPGLRLQNDKISIVGKSGLAVMINDRMLHLSGEDLTNYLRSLSSDDIKSIEVITTPPAKYEAEGNSGLINIVLKKTKKNYSGGSLGASYRQATYPYGRLKGNFTYQKNKWSAFSTLSMADLSYKITETSSIFYPDQQWKRRAIRKGIKKYFSGRAGIDYDISSKISAGVQYVGSLSTPDEKERTNVSVLREGSNKLDSLLFTKGRTNINNRNHAINGHLIMKIDSLGKKISTDIDYFTFNNRSERPYTYQVFEKEKRSAKSSQTFKNTSEQKIQNISSKIDVEWPTKILHLAFGGKVSFSTTDSNLGGFDFKKDRFIKNINQVDTFEYRENIQAVYLSAKKALKKWKFKAGLRMEATQTKGNSKVLGQINKNKYIKLFPTIYIVYIPNDNQSFSLNYSRRISRPGYASLNPFTWFDSPNAYTKGNPFLQPSFTDNWEISHLYKDNLRTALGVYRIIDGRSQITLTKPKEKKEKTVRENFLNGWDFSLSQNYTLKIGKWLESSLFYETGYSIYKSDLAQTIAEQQGWSFYASANNAFHFNGSKTFSASLNVWYNSPQVDEVDRSSASYNVDVGLRADLFKKKWRVSLLATDIFRSNISTIKSQSNGINQRFRNYYDQRAIRLSVRYRFGKKLKNKKRDFSNEKERRRANGGM